jgi:hypothetical protein
MRDQLFTVRDEMFGYACDHGLLDSPAHTNLRTIINSLIRYAHEISFGRLVLLLISRKIFHVYPPMPAVYAEWSAAMAALPPAEAQQFHEFHARALLLIMKHMITGSPPLLLLTGALVIRSRITRSTQRLWDAMAGSIKSRVPLDLIEAQALNAR